MRENQPKYRQMRKEQRRLARQKASRVGMPSILIVCEGRETEPNYIAGLCDAKRVNMAAVKIRSGDSATDAAALVRKARKIYEADREFDRVFVVFDDDGSSMERARQLAQRPLRRSDSKVVRVELIASRPSFEFWLLLHFEYSARPYKAGAEAMADLRRHLTNYNKADPEIFGAVALGLDQAMLRAEQLKREFAATGASVPGTDFPQLVQQLLSMQHNG
jgi:hypothetical protein